MNLIKVPIYGDRTEVYRILDSTQDRLRNIINEKPEEALVVSNKQLKGYQNYLVFYNSITSFNSQLVQP